MNPLSARELILTLIDSSSSATLSARYFVAVGRLFEMDPGAIRVALARLVQDGSLLQAGRGSYRLGSRSGVLHTMVRSWSRVEDALKPWSGAWLGVFTGHLPRADKTQVRGRDRALRLHGFAAAFTGLSVRPDNLRSSNEAVYQTLTGLGLDEHAVLARLDRLEPADAIAIDQLWDRQALERSYRTLTRTLSRSTAALDQMNDDDAARETLLVGRAVTRRILLDPLLPEQLVDAALRRNLIEAMRAYDRRGKAYFRALHAAHN